jgi:hypothetical protein
MSLRQFARAAARRPARPAVAAAFAAAPAVPAIAIVLPAGGPALTASITMSAFCALAAAVYLGLLRAIDQARIAATRPEPVPTSRAGGLPAKKRRELERWESRLNHGWSTTAGAVLNGVVESKTGNYESQVKALAALCGHRAVRARRSPRTLEVDITIVSTLNLRGGTTSANEAEILAYRSAGLKVALVHHPVLDRAMDRPVEERIRDLIDGEQVIEVHPEDTVHCDLAIVRFPVALEKLMEDRPRIEAARTALLVNQTPFEEYGLTGGYGSAWSIRDVDRNVTEWLGPHTWYAIGPAVRDILRTHHAEEIAGIDLADDFWYETIDVAEWSPEERRIRAEDEPIRIGRHSRDHITKFPNMAKRLRAAYPVAEDLEVHMLGGHKALLRILGSIPPGWTSHRFGTMSAVDFLGGIDVYAYFIDENLAEAFGRAPLEAMAAGVPCILPRSFAELFGDGAVYCEPEEVATHARRLAADPAYYAARAAAGLRVIHERFSPEALLHRVNGLGVARRPVSGGAAAAAEPVPSESVLSLGGAR